jgi:hypothetical protein
MMILVFLCVVDERTVVTTLAGSGFGYADGSGTDARFNSPRGVTVDANGNVYVADAGNHRIRKATANVGTVVRGKCCHVLMCNLKFLYRLNCMCAHV